MNKYINKLIVFMIAISIVLLPIIALASSSSVFTGWIRVPGKIYTLFSADYVVLGGSTSEFRLTIDNDGGIIAKGTFGAGDVLTTTGAGTRMIWYPRKASFMAGNVTGTEWDDANVGVYAAAFGQNNIVTASWSSVLGGKGSTNLGNYASIGGGQFHSITALGNLSFIGGGSGNTVSAANGTIGGGSGNTVSAANGTIGGGNSNTVSADNGTIGGGNSNTVSGSQGVIGGGGTNLASGTQCTIAGGRQNTCSNTRSGILGSNNVVSGIESFVYGYGNTVVSTSTEVVGDCIYSTADGSIIIGKGFSCATIPEQRLLGDVPNTIMFGLGSTLPTMTLTAGSGAGTYGKVGVRTKTPNSDYHVAGSFATNIVTKVFADSPYTVSANDYTIICNAVGGAVVINLPTAVGIAGRIYNIKKIDASVNTCTVNGNGAETIDGAVPAALTTQYESITIQNDGANWWIL